MNDPNDSAGQYEQFAVISEQFLAVSEQSFYIWCFTLKHNLRLGERQGERSSICKTNTSK
jgi:hypothetical protein